MCPHLALRLPRLHLRLGQGLSRTRRLFLLASSATAAAAIVGASPTLAALDHHAALLAPSGRCGAAADRLRLNRAAAAEAMLCLTNYARSQERLRPLDANALLDRAGQAKVEADSACRAFGHSPCGQPWDAVFAAYLDGASRYQTGENIAFGGGSYGTPRQTFSLWLRSPGHRANILNPAFHDLGVGYLPQPSFLGYEQVTLWSQEFGSRTPSR